MNWKLRVVAFANAFLLVPSPNSFAQSDKKPTVAELIQQLEVAEGPARDRVMEQLDQIHDADVLVPPLLAALSDVDPKNAPKLLDVLARFPDAPVAAPLVQLARRADRIPQGLEPFLTGAPARKELLKALTDACASWKPPAKNPDASGAEQPAEEDTDAAKSQGFIKWVGRALGQAGSEGLDQLLSMLRDPDACRQSAVEEGLVSNLAGTGKLDPRIVNAVSAALRDSHARVQGTAVDVVSAIVGFDMAPLSKDTLEPLFAILKTNPDYEVRRDALYLLERGPGDVPKKAAELALHDANENIQMNAGKFLDELSDASSNYKP